MGDTHSFSMTSVASCSNVNVLCRMGLVDRLAIVLLEEVVVVDEVDNRAWTCLHEAAYTSNVECIRMVLQYDKTHGKRLTLREQSHDGRTAVMVAVGRSIDALRLLVEAGADVNVATADGTTPLMNACRSTCPTSVALLLTAGASTSAADFDGWTAMHSCAEKGFVEGVRMLADANASLLSSCTSDGVTPLMLAAQYNYVRTVGCIFSLVPSTSTLVNAQTVTDGETGVHIACRDGYDTLLRLLLKHGANVNVGLVHPIVHVVERNFTRCLELLLPHVDVQSVADKKDDPVYIAVKRGSHECLRMLLDHTRRFQLNRRTASYVRVGSWPMTSMFTSQLVTPLGLAVLMRNPTCAWPLVKAGASITIDARAVSPLNAAVLQSAKGPDDILAYLTKSSTCDVNFVSRNLRQAGDDHTSIPDAIYFAMCRPPLPALYRLLMRGCRPRLAEWCACDDDAEHGGKRARRRSDDVDDDHHDHGDGGLLVDMRSSLTRAQINARLRVVRPFVHALPRCCRLWRQYSQGDRPSTLLDLCRVAIVHAINETALSTHDQWQAELGFPPKMVALLQFDDLLDLGKESPDVFYGNKSPMAVL